MTGHVCKGCDLPTDNGYRHGGDWYCPACWEDWQRQQAKDALERERAVHGPAYSASRRCKANYRRR